jgi:hypothetical protein
MGPAEIGLRVSRGVRDRLRRRAEPEPQEDLLTFRAALGGREAGARELLEEEAGRPAAGGAAPATGKALEALGVSVEEIVREADAVLEGSIPAFGHARLDVGPEPDWHRDPRSGLPWPRDVWWSDVDFRFDPRVGDPRYVWELNRHLHLVVLARAFALTGDERYAGAVWRQMTDWIRRNPPHFGINWSSALEVGIRLISWTLALGMTGSCGATDEDLEAVLTSCSLQARHVSDNLTVYDSSRNNHLIGEAAGLLAAGVSLPFLDGAEGWVAKGNEVLEREVPAQLGPDGVSLEQTFHYQVFVMEFALLGIACARSLGTSVSERFVERIARASDALVLLADGADRLPRVGDEDGGRAYVLDDRGDRQWTAACAAADVVARGRVREGARPEALTSAVWLFGGDAVRAALEAPRRPRAKASGALAGGGYYVLGDGRSHGVVDCGPLGLGSIAAHGHADCLSLELARNGRWLLVDPGTYCYHRERTWRDHFRSTAAHNTLTVGGADQSEMLGPFLWGSRAEARPAFWCADGPFTVFAGSHDGYVGRFGATHRRTVALLASGVWVVFDRVEGEGERTLCATYQVAPGLERDGAADGPWNDFKAADGPGLRIGVWGPAGMTTEVVRGRRSPPAGWVSEAFGERTAAPVLEASVSRALPAGFLTVVLAGVEAAVDVSLTDDGMGAEVGVTSSEGEERALFGSYRHGDTVFEGVGGYVGPAAAGGGALGADVLKWREQQRAVDFRAVPNGLRSDQA